MSVSGDLAAPRDGGPRVRVLRVEGAPVVSIRALLPGGARLESTPGTALVTGRALTEGTRARDWRTIAADAEALGMTPASFGGLEGHGVAVDALAAEVDEALALAAELLLEPSFPEERVRWLARQAAGELEAQADQSDLVTARELVRLLHAPHPKGRPLQGDAASLAAIDSELCRAFHAGALARGGCVVIAGAIDAEAVERAARDRFAALAPPRPIVYTGPPAPERAAARREVETRAEDQAHLLIGQLTVARHDPRFEALELAAVVLGAGAGLTGRIPTRVREQEGLAYQTAADLLAGAGLDPGRLALYVGTAEERLGAAERAAREELERFVADGPTASELDEARAFLLGREPFRRETARQQSDFALQAELLGLPLDDPELRRQRLLAVDRDALVDAVRAVVDPERLGVVVGLPRG